VSLNLRLMWPVQRDRPPHSHALGRKKRVDRPKYVQIVEGLVENRIRAGREEEVGGRDVIDRFFSLLEVSRLAMFAGN
jgi:hypothetical protein